MTKTDVRSSVIQNLRNAPQATDVGGGETFSFLVALAEAMWNARDSFPFAPVQGLTGAIQECVTLCLPQWNPMPISPSDPAYHSSYHSTVRVGNPRTAATAKVDRIAKIVDLCLKCLPPDSTVPSSSDLSEVTPSLLPCHLLLADVLEDPTPLADKFKHIYTPLLTRLKETLSRYGQDLALPPFKEVVRGLVGLYMDKFVGSQDKPFLHPSIKKVGCSSGGSGMTGVRCVECNGVDQWLFDPNSGREHKVRAKESIRRHLELQLSTSGGNVFLTWTTIRSGSPHTLSISKKSDVDKLARWETRVKEARAFLEVIGDDEKCRKVLGEKVWREILEVLGGKKIGAGKAIVQSMGKSTDGRRGQDAARARLNANAKAQSSTAAKSTNMAPSSATTSQAGASRSMGAGQKRKRDPSRPVVRGSEVIDLTGLSP